MKCTKCGYEGSRAVFRYLGPIETGVRDSFRLWPSCSARVACDEFAEDEQVTETKVWGLKALGRKSVRGENKNGDM